MNRDASFFDAGPLAESLFPRFRFEKAAQGIKNLAFSGAPVLGAGHEFF
jgi:hypothetical protein